MANLKAFMRECAKTEEVITVPGPPTLKEEDGSQVMLQIKILKNERIQQINDNYRQKTLATDAKGNPYIANGEVAFKVERNSAKATRHIIAEALVYPDLKNNELMEYFECSNIADMPMKVFHTADEYAFVSRAVMTALGLISEPDNVEVKESLIEEAKN